jgi:ribosomal protein S6
MRSRPFFLHIPSCRSRLKFGIISVIMRLYDLVLVLKSSLSDKEREKQITTVKEWLKDVKVTTEDAWGQKPLAYKIKKEISGFYHKMELEAETIPTGFEKRLIQNENILRHLLLRKK